MTSRRRGTLKLPFRFPVRYRARSTAAYRNQIVDVYKRQVIHDMFKRVISDIVAAHFNSEARDQDLNELIAALDGIGFKGVVRVEDIEGRTENDVVDICLEQAWSDYEQKIEKVKDKVLPIEKEVSLRMIDRAWSNHIDTMSKLRDGIGLRSYCLLYTSP